MEKQKENVEIRVLKWERAWNNDIGFFFLGKMKLNIIFMKWAEQVMNLNY